MEQIGAAFADSPLSSMMTGLAQLNAVSSVASDDEYLGWINGENKADVTVEIIFDFMCPGCKVHLSGIESDTGKVSIWDYLDSEQLQVDGKSMSYLEAIELRLTPFPMDGHPHDTELNQVYFHLKDMCTAESTCHLNDYMLFCFENQSEIWGKKN